MMRCKSVCVLAGAALSLGGINAALAQTSSDEVRAIVAETVADAQNRSSLLAAGASAGHDGRFFIAKEDGSFRLNVGGQIQFRYVLDWRDDQNNADDFETGFQTRRTKLDFSGNIINKDWEYRVLAAFDRADGSAILEEAWVNYTFGDGWSAKWGQFKLPLLREELVSSSRQLAVERSLTNEAFTQDRSQGIQLQYRTDDWRVVGAFSDGLDSENTDFTDSSLRTPAGANSFFVRGEADWALTGRIEYKFQGDWKWFEDFTAPQGQDFAALLGGAVHYQEGPNTGAPTDVDRQTLEYTLDLSLEGDGWNVYGAFIGRNDDTRGPVGVDQDSVDDFGAVVQAGWRFQPDTELFARWDAIFGDSSRPQFTNDDNFNFFTVGINEYYAGHAAKATVDVVLSFDDTSSLITTGLLPNTTTGVLGQNGSDTEVTVRFQFQLLF
jgi:hypothetical protein